MPTWGCDHGRPALLADHRAGGRGAKPAALAGRADPRLSRPHREARSHAARVHHRRRRRRAGRRAGARARGDRGRLARAAPRRPARPQGPLPDRGPAHLLRHPHRRLLRGRAALHRGGAARGGRRDHARQAQHDRARARALRRQRAPRRRAEPVAARPRLRRIEQRLGGGGGRGPRRGRARHRHRRLDPAARGVLRGGGAQAHLRPGEPRGRHAAVLVLRSRGPARPHHPRRRAHAGPDRGPRSARRHVEPSARCRTIWPRSTAASRGCGSAWPAASTPRISTRRSRPRSRRRWPRSGSWARRSSR